MITLLLALACLQEDPAGDAARELDALVKKASASGPFGIGAAKEYLELAGQHAGRQIAGKNLKGGIEILALAFDGLAKAIQALETKSPELRKVLMQLEKGKKRAAEAKDDEARGVAYRYAIDRCGLLHSQEAGLSAGLFNMGVEYLSDGNLAEAEEAFTDADAMHAALRGTTPEATPQGPRWAAIFLARVRMMQGKYKQGAADLRRGLAAAPEFVGQEVAYAKLTKKEGEYAKILAKVEDYLKLNNDDKDALLLYAHEKFFSEKRSSAKEPLMKVLQLDAKDSAAKLLMEHVEDE